MNRKSIQQAAIIILCSFFTCLSSAQEKEEIQNFVDTFKKTIEAKELESIMSMNFWKDVPKELGTAIEKQFLEIVEKGVLNIEVEYIADGEDIEFVRGDAKFVPNLSPVAKVNIEIPTKKNFRGGYSFYIGKENEKYLFSHVVPK